MALHSFGQPPLDQGLHFGLEGAHGADQRGLAGDDAHGAEVARLHRAQADHRAVDRPYVARHDALHRRDDVRRHQHRVDRQIGMGAVAATAGDLDGDPVGRRHHRAGIDADRAGPHRRPVVHGIDGIDREALKQPVLDHLLGAGEALLRRAGRPAPRCRRSCASRPGSARRRPASRCGRHGRSRASSRASTDFQAKSFCSIMVSASMSARRPIMRPLDVRWPLITATTPVLPMPVWISSTPHSLQRLLHAAGGVDLLETEFGMRVQVAPQRRQFGMELGDVGECTAVHLQAGCEHQCPPALPTRNRGSTAK